MTAATASTFSASTPSPARIRDYWLGGKSNFQADRDAAGLLAAAYPPPADGHPLAPAEMAVTNRLFLARAVRYAAGREASQVIDLRCGLPVPKLAKLTCGTRVPLQNAHEAARDITPAARCAYVDDDDMALSHVSALLCGEGVAAVRADIADPPSVLSHPALTSVIDLTRPVTAVFGMCLHRYENPVSIVRGYVDALAAGSYLVISVLQVEAESWQQIRDSYVTGNIFNHPPRILADCFGEAAMVPPGLVLASAWRPQRPERMEPAAETWVLAGVGRKA